LEITVMALASLVANLALWTYVLQGAVRVFLGDRARWRWDVVARARRRRRPRQYAVGYLTYWIGVAVVVMSLPLDGYPFSMVLLGFGLFIMVLGGVIERAGGRATPNYSRTTLAFPPVS
jgi:hypothetical protein